jgi:hypothetical protein
VGNFQDILFVVKPLMNKNKVLMSLLLFIMFSSACVSSPPKLNPSVSPISPIQTPVAGPISRSTPLANKSALTGKVISSLALTRQPLANVVVRLAKVYWNAEKSDGAFALDGANSPSTITNESGEFFFANIDPTDYVVVVGDVQVSSAIVSKNDGSAKIFSTNSGQVLDVGTLEVPYAP